MASVEIADEDGDVFAGDLDRRGAAGYWVAGVSELSEPGDHGGWRQWRRRAGLLIGVIKDLSLYTTLLPIPRRAAQPASDDALLPEGRRALAGDAEPPQP